jgi:hypothetical protein
MMVANVFRRSMQRDRMKYLVDLVRIILPRPWSESRLSNQSGILSQFCQSDSRCLGERIVHADQSCILDFKGIKHPASLVPP